MTNNGRKKNIEKLIDIENLIFLSVLNYLENCLLIVYNLDYLKSSLIALQKKYIFQKPFEKRKREIFLNLRACSQFRQPYK